MSLRTNTREYGDDDDDNDEEFIPIDPGRRIVWLTGNINQWKADRTTKCLFALDDGVTPINLIITTGGGEVYATMGIYDVMTSAISSPIRTIGLGKVMSAGVLLLAAGTKGERYLGRHCRLMFHMGSGGMVGAKEDLSTSLKELDTQDRIFNKVLKKHASEEAMVLSLGREKFTTALDAIKLNVADKILTKKLLRPPKPGPTVDVETLLEFLDEDEENEDL